MRIILAPYVFFIYRLHVHRTKSCFAFWDLPPPCKQPTCKAKDLLMLKTKLAISIFPSQAWYQTFTRVGK